MKRHIVSEAAMKSCGEQLGRQLTGGEVIELVGDVGAGKTTFTKGLAVGIGITEAVQSPSFTISRVYDGSNDMRLAHYDFYRLNDAGIMAHDLEESVGDSSTVTVIEWADIVKDALPKEYLEIQFSSPDESSRDLVIQAYGPKHKLLERQWHDSTT